MMRWWSFWYWIKFRVLNVIKPVDWSVYPWPTPDSPARRWRWQ